MFFLIAAAAAAAATVPSALIRPSENPANWVSNDDYPPSAQKAGIQGVVAFTLDVDNTGAVGTCSITSSSGSELLDGQTCRLMKERAKFLPGKDAKGRPTGGQWTSRFRWEIMTSDRLPFFGTVGEPSLFVVRVEVTPQGVIGRCEVLSPPSFREGAEVCRQILAAKPIKPYLDATGKPVAKVLIMRHELEVRDQ